MDLWLRWEPVPASNEEGYLVDKSVLELGLSLGSWGRLVALLHVLVLDCGGWGVARCWGEGVRAGTLVLVAIATVVEWGRGLRGGCRLVVVTNALVVFCVLRWVLHIFCEILLLFIFILKRFKCKK